MIESPPLTRLLHSVGRIQHHLHTVVVGLSAVESGTATKPDDLDITWDPKDKLGSAREARRFLLRSTLVFVAAKLKEYATHILRYRALENEIILPQTAIGRILALAGPEDVAPSYLSIAPLIITHWRNRIIHRDSNARLTSKQAQLLSEHAEAIRSSYKGIEVERLLGDFEADQPKLKETTVLLAMTIKFARIVDSTLPQPDGPKEVRLWLQAEDMLNQVKRLEKEASNGGSSDPRARAKQYLLTNAPSLAQPYYDHGVGPE